MPLPPGPIEPLNPFGWSSGPSGDPGKTRVIDPGLTRILPAPAPIEPGPIELGKTGPQTFTPPPEIPPAGQRVKIEPAPGMGRGWVKVTPPRPGTPPNTAPSIEPGGIYIDPKGNVREPFKEPPKPSEPPSGPPWWWPFGRFSPGGVLPFIPGHEGPSLPSGPGPFTWTPKGYVRGRPGQPPINIDPSRLKPAPIDPNDPWSNGGKIPLPPIGPQPLFPEEPVPQTPFLPPGYGQPGYQGPGPQSITGTGCVCPNPPFQTVNQKYYNTSGGFLRHNTSMVGGTDGGSGGGGSLHL